MKGSVKKEGSSWTYLVYIGTDQNGKKKYKRKRGFRTKKECELALAELITQIDKGTAISNDKMNLNDYLKYWLDAYPKNQCQPSTYKRYKEFCTHITRHLGQHKLSKLNPLVIQKFYEDLKAEKKLANNTIIKIHRMLNLTLKHAQKWQFINTNPCSLATPPKADKIDMRYWQPDEINFYLEQIKYDRLYSPTLLAVHTGLRLGELCALKWEDVDLVDGTVRVYKTLQRIDGKLQMKSPKTKNSERIVTLLSNTITFLKELKKKHMERKLKYGVELDFVLDWEDGRPMDPHYVSQHFPKVLKEKNIPIIRFHDLRHTHATLLLKLGTNAKVISERLGHSTVSFTLDVYSHVNTDMQRSEVSKAESFL